MSLKQEHDTHAPPAIVAPSAQGDDEPRAEETGPAEQRSAQGDNEPRIEERSTSEEKRKREIAPPVIEKAAAEATGLMAGREPERRPARAHGQAREPQARQKAGKAAKEHRREEQSTTTRPGARLSGNRNAINQTASERSGHCVLVEHPWVAGFGRSGC